MYICNLLIIVVPDLSLKIIFSQVQVQCTWCTTVHINSFSCPGLKNGICTCVCSVQRFVLIFSFKETSHNWQIVTKKASLKIISTCELPCYHLKVVKLVYDSYNCLALISSKEWRPAQSKAWFGLVGGAKCYRMVFLL